MLRLQTFSHQLDEQGIDCCAQRSSRVGEVTSCHLQLWHRARCQSDGPQNPETKPGDTSFGPKDTAGAQELVEEQATVITEWGARPPTCAGSQRWGWGQKEKR